MDTKRIYLYEFIITFLIGLYAFLETFSFNNPIALYKYGANIWPACIALVIMVCSIMLYIYRVYFVKKIQETVNSAAPVSDVFCLRKRISIFIIPILFVILLPYIGFYAAVLIFLPLYTWCLGQRNIIKSLAITTLIGSVLIVVFTKYLFVPFPVGTLPGFYEFNSAIVAWMY